MRHRLLFAMAVSCAAWVLASQSVSAHGNNPTLERLSNGYLIDVGFDQAIVAGDELLIDFALIENAESADWSLAQFDQLHFGIVDPKGKDIFVKTVSRQDFGKTFLTYTFPRGGEYRVSTRFVRGGMPLADETFVVPVPSGNRESMPWIWIAAGGAGILAFCVGAMVYTRTTGHPGNET